MGAPDAAEGPLDELGSDRIRQALQGVGAADCDQAAVKIEPNSIRFRFTRRVHHRRLAQSTISC